MKLIKTDRIKIPLTAEEIEEAEEIWIKKISGRLHHSTLSSHEKHPILIPAKVRFTELLVKDAHKKVLHSGMQMMAPLPRDRIEQSPPFAVTGLDFAGPIYFTCRNCGGGDRGRFAIYRPFGEVSLSLNRTVTCMVLKANDRRTSCPCHDEFRGPRSDYVRQDFDKGRIVAYRDCGLLYCSIAARISQDPITVS
ncbi:uncharacterized protein TNCV_138791 [Trichonephila clavipes]|nr:uncharacterized protein TNCV_138791 [Trichonephila clavipes]